MILKLIRFIRGYVTFNITGRFPARFLNLCMRQGRFLFGVKPQGDNFSASLILSDYREIRPLARRAGVRLRISERHGLPFLLARYRLRKGLLAGMLLFVIIALFMQSFVWTIEVNGLSTLSESRVRSQLESLGLTQGVYKKSLDLHAIERSLMQSVEEIGWMSVNIIGTKAEVEIKEKEQKPPILDADTYCNIKAARDGLILEINSKQGVTKTSVGSAVIKGQLLVSSIVENSQEEVYFVHADAEIIAETHRQMTFSASSTGQYNFPCSQNVRKELIFYWLHIPFYFTPVSSDYSSRYECEKLVVNDIPLEFGIVTEHCTEYCGMSYSLCEKQISDRLSADEALYRLFVLKDCREISASHRINQNNGEFSLVAEYTCVEDIAMPQKLVVN